MAGEADNSGREEEQTKTDSLQLWKRLQQSTRDPRAQFDATAERQVRMGLLIRPHSSENSRLTIVDMGGRPDNYVSFIMDSFSYTSIFLSSISPPFTEHPSLHRYVTKYMQVIQSLPRTNDGRVSYPRLFEGKRQSFKRWPRCCLVP